MTENTLRISPMDSTNGTASMDQSKLSTLGHNKIHVLYTGSKMYVRNRVTTASESDAGLSEGANSGVLFPMNMIRNATSRNPINPKDRIPSRIFLFPNYKKSLLFLVYSHLKCKITNKHSK